MKRSIRPTLRRLSALVPAGGELRALSEGDCQELADLCGRVENYLEQPFEGRWWDATVAGVLEDAAFSTAILRLVAAAVRWSLAPPCSDPTSGSSCGAVDSSSSGSSSGSGVGGSSGGGSTSSNCGSTGTSGSPSTNGRASTHTSGPRTRKGSQAQAVLVRGACSLASTWLSELWLRISPACSDFVRKLLRMHTLQCVARRFAEAATSPGALTAQQADGAAGLMFLLSDAISGRALQAGVSTEMIEALRDSRVMEHWARLLLRLLLEGGRWDAMYRMFLLACQNIGVQSEAQDEVVGAALLEVLSGPCIRHVVLVRCIAMVCWMDGGPSYGLPEEVRQAVTAALVDGASRPGGREVPRLDEAVPLSMIAVLGDDKFSPPAVVRATVLLLLRLARLAVAAGDAQAEATQQQQAGGGGAAPPRGVVVVVVAQCVLDHAWPLLRSRLGANAPGWAVAAGVKCWRLMAAALGQDVLRWASDDELRSVGRQLACEWVQLLPDREPLPPAAPPGLTAMLAGGLLPCLERLLRRAGGSPNTPEAVVLVALFRGKHTLRMWASLLEYGEPRQVAALAATLGKVLLCTNPVCLERIDVRSLLSTLCMRLCADLMVQAVRTGGAQPVPKQAKAFAARAWLPVLSGLARQALTGQATILPADTCALLEPLVRWLPLLAHRSSRETAAAGGPAAGDTGSSGSADDARSWLLEEVGVLPLLGGALRQSRLLAAVLPTALLPLAESCCAVAAAFPDEVRRAAAAWAWQPELLRALVPAGWAGGCSALAAGTEALAAMLEEKGPGTGGRGGGGTTVVVQRFQEAAARVWDEMEPASAAAVLMPAAEARALLPICCYRGCASLAGDSEAGARMRWCRFCDAACYCCGECQLAHWREGGHKEACPGGARARPG